MPKYSNTVEQVLPKDMINNDSPDKNAKTLKVVIKKNWPKLKNNHI